MTKPTILFCNACGAALSIEQKAARHPRCELCEHTQWQNPKPVAVLLQPVSWEGGRIGLITIDRGIPPYGWALPGGYVARGEAATAAAVREFEEETCIPIPPEHRSVQVMWEAPSPNGHLMIFVQNHWTMPVDHVRQHFRVTEEALNYHVQKRDDQLCFPLHNEALQKFPGVLW